MQISDLLSKTILPFEIDDDKSIKIFSFFLHSAPTIDSKSSAQISDLRLVNNWEEYISEFPKESYAFLSPNCSIEKYFDKHKLSLETEINRKSKGFVCKKKNTTETAYECLLRHIRNSIAHNNVYICNAGNRKYILFEDFNNNKKQSSRILFSQTDLKKLKEIIMK